ncbi:MAG TPA: hypothetical protein VFQ65_31020 [Kofleriaceae bacterium]|nr:hypothetical protein [Kofleriaceae bacterium]
MRIDREAFFLAVAALAGCERADTAPTPPPRVAPTAQRPAISANTREVVPAPEPVAPVEPIKVEVKPEPVPAPAPKRATARHHQSASKRWFLGLTMDERSNVTSYCAQRAETRCQETLRGVMPEPTAVNDDTGAPDPVVPAEAEEDPVAKLDSAKVAAYCQDDFPAPTCETPLVVAFEGQPIDFAPAGPERFAFVPGEPAATDWPTEATPWIALDLDGDGAITSGAELFGSSTVLATGARALNGFAALAALDANGDGTVDARDPMFSRLVLWSDRNGDHRSSPDELRPLASTVTAISLAFTSDARCNQRDDCEGERGTLHWRDAAGADHTGTVVDVYIPRR